MTGEIKTTNDRFTAEAFEQQREGLWAWYCALGTTDRAKFDADFDAELAVMRQEEAPDARS